MLRVTACSARSSAAQKRSWAHLAPPRGCQGAFFLAWAAYAPASTAPTFARLATAVLRLARLERQRDLAASRLFRPVSVAPPTAAFAAPARIPVYKRIGASGGSTAGNPKIGATCSARIVTKQQGTLGHRTVCAENVNERFSSGVKRSNGFPDRSPPLLHLATRASPDGCDVSASLPSYRFIVGGDLCLASYLSFARTFVNESPFPQN
jgi:hypothetical protein